MLNIEGNGTQRHWLKASVLKPAHRTCYTRTFRSRLNARLAEPRRGTEAPQLAPVRFLRVTPTEWHCHPGRLSGGCCFGRACFHAGVVGEPGKASGMEVWMCVDQSCCGTCVRSWTSCVRFYFFRCLSAWVRRCQGVSRRLTRFPS